MLAYHNQRLSSEKSVEKVCFTCIYSCGTKHYTENIVTPLGTFPRSRATVLPGPKISNVNLRSLNFSEADT